MLIISQPFTGSIEYADPDCGCVMPTPPGGARPLPPQRPGDGGGKPAYATCVSRSDANEGWRDYRREGGLVVDLRTNEIVCEGLSMPHSPRLYRVVCGCSIPAAANSAMSTASGEYSNRWPSVRATPAASPSSATSPWSDSPSSNSPAVELEP